MKPLKVPTKSNFAGTFDEITFLLGAKILLLFLDPPLFLVDFIVQLIKKKIDPFEQIEGCYLDM